MQEVALQTCMFSDNELADTQEKEKKNPKKPNTVKPFIVAPREFPTNGRHTTVRRLNGRHVSYNDIMLL